MNESRFQYECVTWFSQQMVDQHGQLFAVTNEAKNNKDAMYQKSMGVYPGVSDLIYIRSSGSLVGIELKIAGSRHDSSHIRRQCNWLMTVKKLGNEGYFCTSLHDFISVIKGIKGHNAYTPEEVLELIGEKKSFVFL